MPMPFNQPFSPADLPAMAALARAFPLEHLHRTDLPYRFSSWALDDPQNAAVWKDEQGRLQAWAVLQTPFWAIDIACIPDAGGRLFEQALSWADQRAQAALGGPYGHPCWFVNVFAGLAERIQALEQAGFACQSEAGEDSWSKVFMERAGQEPAADYRLPPGYTLRALGGEREVPSYVDLHRAVFGTNHMTVDWRLQTLRQPGYIPELDLVVQAPDERLAAFCVCWLDGNTGQVEPLGCHEDFRRYALGRVVLAEGLRRLRSLGAERIQVETDNYRNTALLLYEHMGFKVLRDVLVFRKDYGGNAENFT